MSLGPNGRRLGERIAGRMRARIYDDAGCVTDVYILDHSTSGVRIETPLGVSLPRRFTIRFNNREHFVEIVWRRGRDLGARFVTCGETTAKPMSVKPAATKKTPLDELRGLARGARR
jgi:hypothetical protein